MNGAVAGLNHLVQPGFGAAGGGGNGSGPAGTSDPGSAGGSSDQQGAASASEAKALATRSRFTEESVRRIEAADRCRPPSERPWSKSETGSSTDRLDRRKSRSHRPSTYRGAAYNRCLPAAGRLAARP